MKRFFTSMNRFFAALLALAFVAAAGANAQTKMSVTIEHGKLQIESLDRLSAKASETINVSLDERLLRIVPWPKSNDADDQNLKKLVAELKGVYVKRFEFDTENQYAEADVAPIREQLRAPGWTKIVEIRSRREGKNVEVYLRTNGSRIEGLTVLSVEPKELLVVNLVGSIDLEKLAQLEGQFGIPELELERDETKTPPKKQ
jgi:hypothetical protein